MLSDDVATMVHAFGDDGRRAAVRDLASRVRALEAEHDEWRRRAEILATALEKLSAGLGDRLLANGPLSEAYAWGIDAAIKVALSSMPRGWREARPDPRTTAPSGRGAGGAVMARCYSCGRKGDDTCPLCGKTVCMLCAEEEGESCCDVPADRVMRVRVQLSLDPATVARLDEIAAREGLSRSAVVDWLARNATSR